MPQVNEYHLQYYYMALEEASVDLASLLPRVLIVSRRTVRKNKFVDFVGEYHLDLIVKYGAVPVIVPRVSGLDVLLDSFEPIHGVLLCEGEDVDPSLYENDSPDLSLDEIEEIKKLHSSDTTIDKDKDSIEFRLARRCLERHVPFLGICRGSQVLNVACGGSLYQDVERELERKGVKLVKHIDYNNYDGHRHPINVVKDTPLYEWFKGSIEGSNELVVNVNSYHHQGVKKLAPRFKPMAYSPCGLIEAFYDPDVYNPEEGKFIVGLQFHPERMRHEQDVVQDGVLESVFDYPGCPCTYQEFVKAVNAYQKKLLNPRPSKFRVTLDIAMEKHRQEIVQSFCFAKHLYDEQNSIRKNHSMHDGRQALRVLQNSQLDGRHPFKALQISQQEGHKFLEVGANFLESTNTTTLNKQQEKMLKQVGATIRDSSSFLERLCQQKDKELRARMLLMRLGTNQLHDLLDYYKMMVTTTSEVLEQRQNLNNS